MMELFAEKQYMNAAVEQVNEELSPVKKTPLLVWHLIKDDGKKVYHRVSLSEAAKPVILAEFQRAGFPLVRGLEKGCEEIRGARIRICIDEKGDVHIVGRAQ